MSGARWISIATLPNNSSMKAILAEKLQATTRKIRAVAGEARNRYFFLSPFFFFAAAFLSAFFVSAFLLSAFLLSFCSVCAVLPASFDWAKAGITVKLNTTARAKRSTLILFILILL